MGTFRGKSASERSLVLARNPGSSRPVELSIDWEQPGKRRASVWMLGQISKMQQIKVVSYLQSLQKAVPEKIWELAFHRGHRRPQEAREGDFAFQKSRPTFPTCPVIQYHTKHENWIYSYEVWGYYVFCVCFSRMSFNLLFKEDEHYEKLMHFPSSREEVGCWGEQASWF